MRKQKAAATVLARFREAVAFSHGLIGLSGAEDIMQSKRIQGAAYEGMDNKVPAQESAELTVEQLKALEAAAVHLPSGPKKLFAGFLCFLVHSRARFSDTFCCLSEPTLDIDMDGIGYCEVGVTDTKTSTGRRKKKMTSLVAHATGVYDSHSWAEHWLNERARFGLNAKGGPLMPAVSETGVWPESRMSNSECNLWMRDLLKELEVDGSSTCRIASHSCKRTLLAWAAKAGIPASIRRVLGHHYKSKDKCHNVRQRRDGWSFEGFAQAHP